MDKNQNRAMTKERGEQLYILTTTTKILVKNTTAGVIIYFVNLFLELKEITE